MQKISISDTPIRADKNTGIDGQELRYLTDGKMQNVSKKVLDEFKQLVYKTNGKANYKFFLDMLLTGIPKKAIEIAANHVVMTDEARAYSRILRNTRTNRKARGTKPRRVQYCYAKIKELFDEKEMDTLCSAGLADKYYNETDSIARCIYYECFDYYYNLNQIVVPFIKMSDEKRQKILNNSATSKMVATANYMESVPAGLTALGFDAKRYIKKQAEDYYRDVYALADASEDLGLDYKDNYDKPRTVSEIGYQNSLINDAKSYALSETANLSLERMGLGMYHLGTYHTKGRYVRRGYKRMLQRINTVAKQYDKLIKQQQQPEVARTAAKKMLEFWLEDGDHTDRSWKVFERATWDKPVVEPKKAKKASTKSKKLRRVSIDEFKAILANASEQLAENEQQQSDEEQTNDD